MQKHTSQQTEADDESAVHNHAASYHGRRGLDPEPSYYKNYNSCSGNDIKPTMSVGPLRLKICRVQGGFQSTAIELSSEEEDDMDIGMEAKELEKHVVNNTTKNFTLGETPSRGDGDAAVVSCNSDSSINMNNTSLNKLSPRAAEIAKQYGVLLEKELRVTVMNLASIKEEPPDNSDASYAFAHVKQEIGVAHLSACLKDSRNSSQSGDTSLRDSASSVTIKSEASYDYDDPTKPYKCDTCPSRFTKEAGLEKHIKSIHTNKKKFKCRFCVASFPTQMPLSAHEKLHTGQVSYDCEQCDATFPHPSGLKRHVEKQHTAKCVFKCSMCKYETKLEHYYKRHMEKHDANKDLKCEDCNESFISKLSYRKHRRSVHDEEKPLICVICRVAFDSRSKYYSHMNSVHKTEERQFKCPTCDKSFNSNCSLQDHILIHTGEKPHKCSVCKYAFRLKGSLNVHMRIHTGEKPYKCEQCEQAFVQRAHLHRHVRVHHSGGNQDKNSHKVHKCDKCNAKYEYPSELRRHKVKHEEGKIVTCEECQMTFSHPQRLKWHMAKHRGEVLHQCKLCDKTFPYASVLKKHKATHSSHSEYQCLQCSATFRQSSSLEAHMWKHSGSKGYKCDKCPSTFAWKSNLWRHKFIHTKAHLATCDICHKQFADKYILRKHKLIHDRQQKVNKCLFCDMTFSLVGNLKNHLKSHKGEELDLSEVINQTDEDSTEQASAYLPHSCSICSAVLANKWSLKKHMMIHTDERPFKCNREECDAAFRYNLLYNLFIIMYCRNSF